jgi:hypothetical protein
MTVLVAASHWVYWLTFSGLRETGGERAHKTGSKFAPLPNYPTKGPARSTSLLWLKYPFPNAGG